MGTVQASEGIKEVKVRATIIRANGQIEDQGVIAEWDSTKDPAETQSTSPFASLLKKFLRIK